MTAGATLSAAFVHRLGSFANSAPRAHALSLSQTPRFFSSSYGGELRPQKQRQRLAPLNAGFLPRTTTSILESLPFQRPWAAAASASQQATRSASAGTIARPPTPSTSLLHLVRNRIHATSLLLSRAPIGRITPVKRAVGRASWQGGSGGGGSGWGGPSGGGGPLGPFIRRINRLPDWAVLWTLIGLNALVFLGWQYSLESWRKFRDPRAYVWMARNFLTGEGNLRAGRFWTLITSCVSHEDFAHFGINMLSLYFMAPPVLSLVGPATFLGLYFGSGLASSLISAGWHRFVDPWVGRGSQAPGSMTRPTSQGFSHGASGSVYAIMATFACIMPSATFLIFFVIPAPAWACVSGIFAWDIYQAWFKPGGRTDSAGHVGGIAAGLLFWRFRLRGKMLRGGPWM